MVAPDDAAGPGRVGARFAALTSPNYRLFVAGQTVSLVGSWTETIAQALLALTLTHSPLILGTAAALRYLPVLLLSPYAGVIVDRHDRRRTLLLTQSLLAAVSLLFGVAVLAGVADIWLLMVVAVAFGVLTAFDNPARMAFIPELVPPGSLHSAITLNSILANVGRGVGPVVAAALIGTIGIGWCFIANAASFTVVIGCILAMRTAQLRLEGTVRAQRGQLRTGLRVARGNAQLLGPLLMMAIVGTLTYEFEVSLPVFAEATLGAGESGYAWLTAAFGGGAVIAGIVLLFFPQTGLARMIVVSSFYGLSVAVAAVSPTEQFATVALVAVGACSIAFLTTGNATIQLAAPPGMRGRITALWTTAFIGTTPIGALIMGAVGQAAGGRAALAVGAIAGVVAAAVGTIVLRRMSPVRRRTGTGGDVG